MVMLKKLLGVGSFATMMGHLACHHVILPISSKGFGLLSMVRFVVLTLGCWALITHALIICFQQDDHLVILDVEAYVRTNIFLFQLVMQDT